MYPSMPLLTHSTRDSLHREVHYSDLSTKKTKRKRKEVHRTREMLYKLRNVIKIDLQSDVARELNNSLI